MLAVLLRPVEFSMRATALGPPVSKKDLRLLDYAGLCCERGIGVLSALRACESWSIANPRKVNSFSVGETALQQY